MLASVGLATPVPRTSELEAGLPGQGQGLGLGQGQLQEQGWQQQGRRKGRPSADTVRNLSTWICSVQARLATLQARLIFLFTFTVDKCALVYVKKTFIYITLHKFLLNKLVFSQLLCKFWPGECFKVGCLLFPSVEETSPAARRQIR